MKTRFDLWLLKFTWITVSSVMSGVKTFSATGGTGED